MKCTMSGVSLRTARLVSLVKLSQTRDRVKRDDTSALKRILSCRKMDGGLGRVVLAAAAAAGDSCKSVRC